ncbi:MAG: hypothetical protein ABIN61_03225 [candidate division WOR-3 bacterium]
MLIAELTGFFPRSPELIKATRDYDRGRLDKEELEQIREKDVRKLIDYQKDFEYITDGNLLWQDLLRPFVKANGIECGALTRFFRTNTFYRKPLIKGKIKFNPEEIENFFYGFLIPERRKVIIPGPISFFYLSEDFYKKDTLFMITEVIRDVSEYLEKKGVSCIQFSEPSIAFLKFDPLWKECYTLLTKNLKIETTLHIPWGDFSHLQELLFLPVNSIIIDFLSTSIENLNLRMEKRIGIGCIDAQISLIEEELQTKKFVEKVISKFKIEKFFICPNMSLEFLPYEIAISKLEVLRRIAEAFS